jgi:hypothetical protein
VQEGVLSRKGDGNCDLINLEGGAGIWRLTEEGRALEEVSYWA